MQVLVVDDEAHVRAGFVRLLRIAGYATAEASSGAEALEILASESVSLVISDVLMPNMTGHVLLEKIQERYPEVKVVLITGYSSPRERKRALKAGAAAFLSKPIRYADLVEAVRRAGSLESRPG